MAFKMKYEIKADYLTEGTKRRSGIKMPKVVFGVAHDTGNPNSTAEGNVGYYERSRNEMSASAHIFVDDNSIVECIPALTGTPEKAWHVLYNIKEDNRRYGDDANDVAIGVELCFGNKINNQEAYKRYVWVWAYICYKFKLDPRRDIIGHDQLDPNRKIDPTNAFKNYLGGKTFTQFLYDVQQEYKECTGVTNKELPVQQPTAKEGKVHVIQHGDTLWGLSRKYNTTVAKLKILNPELNVNNIPVGYKLLIEKATQPAPPSQPVTPPEYDWITAYLQSPPVRPYPGRPVKYGDKGSDVKAIQRALGITADGVFGKGTEKAVKNYQSKFKIAQDGIVGKITWNIMF